MLHSSGLGARSLVQQSCHVRNRALVVSAVDLLVLLCVPHILSKLGVEGKHVVVPWGQKTLSKGCPKLTEAQSIMDLNKNLYAGHTNKRNCEEFPPPCS